MLKKVLVLVGLAVALAGVSSVALAAFEPSSTHLLKAVSRYGWNLVVRDPFASRATEAGSLALLGTSLLSMGGLLRRFFHW
jgi:hypothetical protein